jgi:hypothetical protein
LPAGDLPTGDLPTGASRYIVSVAIEYAEDHMAAGPDLRIGDAEREAAADHLREHFAQGRLTQEEFTERLDAVFAAKTQNQLGAISSDLPHPAARPSAPLPVGVAAGSGQDRARQDYRSGPRPRLGFVPLIIAALAAWLLILDLGLRAFPWPGKLAIFVAIFAAIRGLVRRLLIGRARGHRGYRCGGGGPRGARKRYARRSWDI